MVTGRREPARVGGRCQVVGRRLGETNGSSADVPPAALAPVRVVGQAGRDGDEEANGKRRRWRASTTRQSLWTPHACARGARCTGWQPVALPAWRCGRHDRCGHYQCALPRLSRMHPCGAALMGAALVLRPRSRRAILLLLAAIGLCISIYLGRSRHRASAAREAKEAAAGRRRLRSRPR